MLFQSNLFLHLNMEEFLNIGKDFLLNKKYYTYLYYIHLPFQEYTVKMGLAFFHEIGQVGEDNDATLFEDFKTSTGVGIRAVLSDVVLRGDWATGEEGSQVTVFVGYPF